ncbi:MAG: DUF2304 domain-containing protein [Propionibacteriaceae bacterium]|jgi:hypothetical protein|nr:DUF2304 domain-containing protein [Propionibacteriaceae bacterium]
MRAIIFFCIITVAILTTILLLLRSGKLKEKHALLWTLIGIACLVLVTFPGALDAVAHLVGFQVGSNLLFTLAILLLMGVCLQLSLQMSAQEDKVRRLAEEAAILRHDLEAGRPSPGHRSARIVRDLALADAPAPGDLPGADGRME